ncbi:O-antigen ligase family protein [Vibrio sp. 1-Bac 57]
MPLLEIRKHWLVLLVYFTLFTAFTFALSNKALPLVAIFEKIKWVMLIVSLPILVVSISKIAKVRITRLLIPFFIFIIFQFTSAIFISPDPFGTILKSILMLYIVYLGFFFTESNLTSISLKSVSYYFGVFCCYISILSLLSTLLGVTYLSGGRLIGLLDNANMLGALSAIGFVFLMNQTFFLKKIKYGALACVMIYIVYLTQSRSAIYGCLIVFIYMLILYKYLSDLKNVLYLIVILSIFLFFYYLSQPEITIRELSLDNRLDLFTAQLNTFYYSPWIGIGLGDDNLGYFVNLAESTYFSLLPSSGLFGTLAFISLLSMVFFTIRDALTKTIFTLICILSLSEAYLIGIGNPISIYFYLLIGSIRYLDKEG